MPRRASADIRVHLRRDFFFFSICLVLTQHLLMAGCHLLCSPAGDAVMVVVTSHPLFVTTWFDRNCRSTPTPLTAPPTPPHMALSDGLLLSFTHSLFLFSHARNRLLPRRVPSRNHTQLQFTHTHTPCFLRLVHLKESFHRNTCPTHTHTQYFLLSLFDV